MEGAGSASGGVPRWLLGAAALLLVGGLLYALRSVLTPIAFAFLVAYLCDPLVDRLERWRVPRGPATAVVLGGALLLMGAGLLLWLPAILSEVADFGQRLPGLLEQGFEQLRGWLRAQGVEVPDRLGDALRRVRLDPGVAKEALAPAATLLHWLVGGTASVADAVMALLMVPVFSAYLLYDFDRIVEVLRDLLPRGHRERVVELAREVDAALAAFVRGQISVMLVLSVLYAVVYSVVGVPLAVPIGVVAGLLSFVPYVGGAVALGLALLMSLLHWSGWGQIVALLCVYGLVQALEGFLITPRLVGAKTGLSDVWVLFALMAGGELFGFLGVLLALPGAAVARVFVLRAVRAYRASELYRGAQGEEEGSASRSVASVERSERAPPPMEPGVRPAGRPEGEGEEAEHEPRAEGAERPAEAGDGAEAHDLSEASENASAASESVTKA